MPTNQFDAGIAKDSTGPTFFPDEDVKRELTFGEKAVGISFTFNPSSNLKVRSIKRRFADLIDELEGYRNPQNSERHQEVSRMLSIAITECQSAQMWAVKAATWQY